MAWDCTVNTDPNVVAALDGPSLPHMVGGGFDSEYAALMAQLGEGGGGPAGNNGKASWAASSIAHDITAGGSNNPSLAPPRSLADPCQ